MILTADVSLKSDYLQSLNSNKGA